MSNAAPRTPVVYPMIFPLFPILSLYSSNRAEVHFTLSVALALVAGVALGLVVFAVFCVSTRQPHKSGLATTILTVFFFSYGHVSEHLSPVRVASVSLGSGRFLAPAFAAAGLLCVILVLRSRTTMRSLTRILNPTVAFLALLPLLAIGVDAVTGPRASRAPVPSEFDEVGPVAPGRTRPDVYYIILDGYPNNTVLREVYGFDNTAFTARLGELGFDVAPTARSNYATTFLSLASSLNGIYVDRTELGGAAGRDRSAAYELIQDSAVLRFFKRSGYTVVNIPSGWGPTDNLRLADVQRFGHLDEFAVVVLETTGLRLLRKFIAGMDARMRIVAAFETLGETANRPGPTFTFAHLMIPHPPYLFGRSGNPVDTKEMKLHGDVWLQKGLFLDQLLFANEQVLSATDRILKSPGRGSIIILQADHGTASQLSSRAGAWDRPDDLMVFERMGILSAMHVPPGCEANPAALPASPVNTFRYLLRRCYGLEMQMLEERSYFSSYASPYEFTDVTALVKSNYSD